MTEILMTEKYRRTIWSKPYGDQKQKISIEQNDAANKLVKIFNNNYSYLFNDLKKIQ